MKRVFMTTVVVLTLTGFVFAQDKIDVKGGWTMSIETPQGATPITLKFNDAEGEKITGTLFAPQGEIAVTGKLTGKDISFGATFETPNGSFPLTFTGTIENADSMSGAADFGGRGGGKWTAKRAK